MIKLRTVCKNEIGSLFFCQGKGDIIHELKMQFSILETKVNLDLPTYCTNPTLIFPRLLHVIGVP